MFGLFQRKTKTVLPEKESPVSVWQSAAGQLVPSNAITTIGTGTFADSTIWTSTTNSPFTVHYSLPPARFQILPGMFLNIDEHKMEKL